MDISVKAGKYVVAVSGGVDSMVLLDLLSKSPVVELVVAHFNHGIRNDSDKDEKLVAAAAEEYKLPLVVGNAKLGAGASEEKARLARYEFLNSVKETTGAKAIITAHHQDDLIETAFINILRGTGVKGLTAMSDNAQVIRPLLDTSKNDIVDYAKTNNIAWREDSSNQEERYLRNYLRLNVLPKLSAVQRQKILKNLDTLTKQGPLKQQALDQLAGSLIENQQLDRSKFSILPSEIAAELLIFWLRQNEFYDYDKRSIIALQTFVKTGRPSAVYNLSKKFNIILTKRSALIETKG